MSWQPMQPARVIIRPELRAAADAHPRLAAELDRIKEIWRNNTYIVIVERSPLGFVTSLSIRRDDREAIHDWRDFQQIKNDIAGSETEAVELYPAESRLVDSANQYWLWVLPPGVQLPLGFAQRLVDDENTATVPGARQRAFSD